jgi:hypothetical protein
MQLNIIVEGLSNESLLPAVFFEQDDNVEQFRTDPHRAALPLRSVGDYVDAITIDEDATLPPGQIAALHRFYVLTGNETLQRLKWSIESARRNLLDGMVGVMHRKARLVQLNLGNTAVLRRPELADEGTEAQLRGYVMLLGAKLPAASNAGSVAALAVRQLRSAPGVRDAYSDQYAELVTLQQHWRAMLRAIERSVDQLDSAVTHEWREKMLYEQEQARSEQEALAEMERSRRGRLETSRLTGTAYNAFILILTVVLVIYAVRSLDTTPTPNSISSWGRVLLNLSPVLVGAAAVYVLPSIVLVAFLGRRARRKGGSDSYGYEFEFHLDADTDATTIRRYLAKGRGRGIAARTVRHDDAGPTFRHLRHIHTGSGRIERVSSDATTIKIHSIVTFHQRRWSVRYARFEVVHEVMARTVAEQPHYVLRQTRVFGDTPEPLSPDEVLWFARFILEYAAQPCTTESLNLVELLGPVQRAYV